MKRIDDLDCILKRSMCKSVGAKESGIAAQWVSRTSTFNMQWAKKDELGSTVHPLRNANSFTLSYVEAMLWSTTGDDDRPLDADFSAEDLSGSAALQVRRDCDDFLRECGQWITEEHCLRRCDPMEQAGHDFWLTRCGHGSGFGYGHWSDEADEAMTAYSRKMGNQDPYISNGKIYL